MHLFHRGAIVVVLGSGSKGNCTYVGDGKTGVLIDCGVSTRQIADRMEAAGLTGDGPLGAPVDAVLVTHEHSDHVAAAGVLDRRLAAEDALAVPFYMTEGTRRRVNPKVMPRNTQRVRADRSFRVGELTIEALTLSHDTLEPVAYVIDVRGTRVGVITDLGKSTPNVERAFASLDVAVLEFNHDLRMLREGSYPPELKRRVEGQWGHLSNEQSAAVTAHAGRRLSHLVLAHLSEENNTPAKAERAASEALHRIGRRDVNVLVGSPTEPVRVGVDPFRIAPVLVEHTEARAVVEPRPVAEPDRVPVRGRQKRASYVPPEQGSLFGPSSWA